MSNTLHPCLDTPYLNKCIDQVFGPPLATEAEADAARQELAYLKQCVRDMKDQMERSSKALGEVSAERMKSVDKLCDIRDTLKPHLMPLGEWTSGAECAIREVLGKHFGVDISK